MTESGCLPAGPASGILHYLHLAHSSSECTDYILGQDAASCSLKHVLRSGCHLKPPEGCARMFMDQETTRWGHTARLQSYIPQWECGWLGASGVMVTSWRREGNISGSEVTTWPWHRQNSSMHGWSAITFWTGWREQELTSTIMAEKRTL